MAYTIDIYVALPGTPLLVDPPGGVSDAGHMWYRIGDGNSYNSYGFRPKDHGNPRGPGEVVRNDADNYQHPYYHRTIEITEAQYRQLKQYGDAGYKEQWTYFNGQYNGATNSCIDFTWGALHHAGLHPTMALPYPAPEHRADGVYRPPALHDGARAPMQHFDGAFKPMDNIAHIRSIEAPIPNSPLNKEQHNPRPAQNFKQWLFTENNEQPVSETALLAQHSNPTIAAFHDRVQNEPTMAGYSETERSRVAASACVECQKTGKNLAGMTEVESYDVNGRAVFTADDPVKAARNPYTSSATVDIAKAVETPVQDSLNQMQTIQMTQAQAQEQAQTRVASGPVIS